jgi:hypothetical protein
LSQQGFLQRMMLLVAITIYHPAVELKERAMKVWVARIWIEQYESIAVFTSEDLAEQFIWSIIRHNASEDELENLPNDLSDAAQEVDEDSDFTIEECEVFDRPFDLVKDNG